MGGIVTRTNKDILPLEVNEHKLYVPLKKSSPWNHYESIYKIGEGAFSECKVSVKNHHAHNKFVIKHIHSDYVLPNYRNEVEFEFNILSQLSHPSIVKLHEVYSHYGDYFMVTEFLAGGELFDAICDKEIYLEDDARRVMVTIMEAIQYCHSRNVIHRDLKPENLILSSKGYQNSIVKIIDFGFARVVGNDKELPHDLRGTPYYLAPEVIKQVPYSKPVDIWSMGCIFHLMLVGVLPFESHDIDKLYKLIKTGHLVFQKNHWKDINSRAIDLVQRMLEVDPEKRITAEQVLDHPWIREPTDNNLSLSLEQMKIWQRNRKLKGTALLVHSTVAFQKAGEKFRRGLIKAAKQAKELERNGISWKLTADEIQSELNSHKKIVDANHSQITYSASISEH